MDRHQLPSYRRIPQPLFKFLPEEFAVGLVKRGSVRIGTAHDFRRTELHNAARGDPSEATPNSVALIDDVEIKPDAPMSDYLARHFAPNAWPTRMQDCIIEEIGEPNQDCFIYCLTGKHRWHFYDAFAATACVRIVDVPGFVECLAQHLASRTDGWDFARVTYGYRFGPLNDAHDRAPPFVKPPNYAWQDELRLVWLPKGGELTQPFNTEVPGLGAFCELVPRRPALGAWRWVR